MKIASMAAEAIYRFCGGIASRRGCGGGVVEGDRTSEKVVELARHAQILGA